MYTWRITVFVVLSFLTAQANAHNLILIVPEALPAVGVNQTNAPTLARLRREGVNFANSHSSFPRLAADAAEAASSDLSPESLIAAAAGEYVTAFIEAEGSESLDPRVATTLSRAKVADRPFVIVYRLGAPEPMLEGQGGVAARPAYAPDPSATDAALAAIESTLKSLDLYDVTNIVVAAEHSFSRVLKVSHTSRARSKLPGEETLGTLPAGFLAIDLVAALQTRHPDLELFDMDAGNSFVDWDSGGHPRQGNAIIATDYDPSRPYVTVQAHGVYDSIQLSDALSWSQRKALAGVILEVVLEQDYLGGIFVNERRLGKFPGALPMQELDPRTDASELPDIAIVFASIRERCEPARICTSVIADTPLAEGEGIANGFDRVGTAVFMAARGPDFHQGLMTWAPASHADLARTLAKILGVAGDDAPAAGRLLREILIAPRPLRDVAAKEKTRKSKATDDGLVTEMRVQVVGRVPYFDAIASSRHDYVAVEDRPRRRWHLPRPKAVTISISDD